MVSRGQTVANSRESGQELSLTAVAATGASAEPGQYESSGRQRAAGYRHLAQREAGKKGSPFPTGTFKPEFSVL